MTILKWHFLLESRGTRPTDFATLGVGNVGNVVSKAEKET